MTRQNKVIQLAQAASNMMGAAAHLVYRAVSSLGVWLLPITVATLVAAALTGGLSLHRSAGPNAAQDITALGERPFMEVGLYYSHEYIDIIKQAGLERRDVLASFGTLDSAWHSTSAAGPLVIRLVTTSLPEPITGKAAAPILTATPVLDEFNLQRAAPAP